MKNGEERANFWKSFILENAQYPDPSRLRVQLEGAQLFDFCECGCNTFRVRPTASNLQPLIGPRGDLPPGAGASIFEADFELLDGKTLEIIVFADREGNLSEIEIDCCFNSHPVPEKIEIAGPPFHVHSAHGLFTDPISA